MTTPRQAFLDLLKANEVKSEKEKEKEENNIDDYDIVWTEPVTSNKYGEIVKSWPEWKRQAYEGIINAHRYTDTS